MRNLSPNLLIPADRENRALRGSRPLNSYRWRGASRRPNGEGVHACPVSGAAPANRSFLADGRLLESHAGRAPSIKRRSLTPSPLGQDGGISIESWVIRSLNLKGPINLGLAPLPCFHDSTIYWLQCHTPFRIVVAFVHKSASFIGPMGCLLQRRWLPGP